MPGVLDTGWVEQFCVGCQQVTWHFNGLCSNRDFHMSALSSTISQIPESGLGTTREVPSDSLSGESEAGAAEATASKSRGSRKAAAPTESETTS